MLDQANHVAKQAAKKTHWTAGNRGTGGTRGSSDRGERVRKSPAPMRKRWACPIFLAILSLGAVQAAAAAAPVPQRDFASTEEAVDAFVTALREHKEADLRTILGPDADRVIQSGDRYADQKLHESFVALFDQKHAIAQKEPGRAELDVGPDDWPFPVLLAESNGRWSFDTKAGLQTIADRPVGRSELLAIRMLLACVDAERDYFDRAMRATGTGVYAIRLVSTPGKHDGLYWPVTEGETESPLGLLMDAAHDAGSFGELAGGKPMPYEGYYFRILTAEGSGANRGFALVAWPAHYESSGIMTLTVDPDGNLYQKDLGPDTARIADRMTTVDLDLTWARVVETND
jgi:hypothetical protein